MLQDISDEKLKELALIYDMQDTFISLYLDVSRDIDWKFIEHRERQCLSALKADKKLLKAFEDNINKIKLVLKKNVKEDIARNNYRGIALFRSEPMQFFEAFGFPHEIKNSMVVDTSPYIRPLAQMMDEWESYAIILINNNEAQLFSVSLGSMMDKKRLVAHIMNKHKKGGWSQMRFNRLRREAIEQFQKKVVEALGKFIEQEKIVGLVLAGPGEAKLHFRKELPQHLEELVLAELDYQMDSPSEKLIEAATLEVAKIERQISANAVERLRNEILKNGLAVYGIKETVQATREGKAELLILSKELKPRGWICEHCQVVETGSKKTCPYCGNKTSEVDVLEEILEFAERAGTHIEFVGDNPVLEQLGGVGALLRY
jgi:peptide chain release factor subunit 1